MSSTADTTPLTAAAGSAAIDLVGWLVIEVEYLYSAYSKV